MQPGPELRDEPWDQEPVVFRYQGLAAEPRKPSVTFPPVVQLPAELTEEAPEPLLPRSRTGLWGVLIGVLVVGGGTTAAMLASAESVLDDEEATPAPPSQAPEPVNVVSASSSLDARPAVEAVPVQAASSPVVAPVVAAEPAERTGQKKISRARSRAPAPVKPAAPTSEVTLSRFSATGSLSAAEVRAGLLPLLGRLRDCHNTALQHGQRLQGTVAVNLEIRGNSVESLDLKTALGSMVLRGCFRKALVGAVFSSGSGSAYTQARVEFFLLARPSSG